MSDDGFDEFDDVFGLYDDLDYQEDDDLAALVDSMAETAFAQGEPIWNEFDVEYDTTEYHSDWSNYSDGGFLSDEEQAGEEEGNKKPKPEVSSQEGLAGGGVVSSGATGKSTKVARRPIRKRRKLTAMDGSGKEISDSTSVLEKVTATVIVPQTTAAPVKKPVGVAKINGVDKRVHPGKDSTKTRIDSRADVASVGAPMKRKPSTDEASVSP